MRKSKRRKNVGGLNGAIRVSNIKKVGAARGVGPDHGGPGFATSAPTHVRVGSGSKMTFAL